MKKKISLEQHQSEQFYKLHKFLFTSEFDKMSNDSKITYCLLRDRHSLSIENNWVDENGDIYLIYTRQQIADMLNRTKRKVIDIMKELVEFELIEEHKQGLNKPNLIYMLDYVPQTLINKGSEKYSPPEVKNIHPNKTYYNKTDKKEFTHESEHSRDDVFVFNDSEGFKMINDYCNERFGLNVRRSRRYLCDDYSDVYESDLIDFLDKRIKTYEQMNIDYLNTIAPSLSEARYYTQ